ncbi:MAG TPA: DEAD/DEAH box helicase [Kofleriaceae bacterium]|nr:DEAD/DEAH box helicase [Kofleriaceae bacterium]
MAATTTTLSAGDLELAFVEKFFWSQGKEPYPVQEQAIAAIVAGQSLLVCVPTGTGKTMMAKAGIYAALAKGQRVVYTTPLRALTEEKYRELCADFGEDQVGFATGDYKVNRDAPVQVEVAEILWNRIVGEKNVAPADLVIMDEGHYFNDPERGYVWEQSIIGLDPRAQLVILSATVGHPERFTHWIELTRKVKMGLIDSRERKVPLEHQFREELLLDTVKDLSWKGDVPAIIFVFGREACFDVARLLKSCRRFTSDEEKAKVEAACDAALLPAGCAKELRPLLTHGIGIHHAGILPRYKQLVEQLVLDRLIKFVVSTETIAAGINLPARTVVFPSLKKVIKKEPRLVTPAEFHQMAGRAGRPQFDDRGLAIALAPEQVVVDLRKELKDAGKRGAIDEVKIRKTVYGRAKNDAVRNGDLLWTPETHADLVRGEPAELRSKTKITAEQVLAIGLPDLTSTSLPGHVAGTPRVVDEIEASLPPSMRLDVVTVIDHLLIDPRERVALHKQLAMLVDNMKAIGVIDEHGKQVRGDMIKSLQGMDGLFVYHLLRNEQLDYEDYRAVVELLVEHEAVQRIFDRKVEDVKREWCRNRLRELRMENGQAAWEDAEAEWDRAHPYVPSRMEEALARFCAEVPHPELHGGKKQKRVWAMMEDERLGFLDLVEREGLQHEEGSLFSYLVRCMNTARKLGEASELEQFTELAEKLKLVLAAVDARLWS